jgi:CRISPR-associated protein Csb2
MLSVAIELLTGRYTATAFNDWSATEWPPHPARLLSALVATWADDDRPDPAERAVLGWLEAQSSPTLSCSSEFDVGHRAAVTVFVPVNDPTTLTRDVHRSSYESVVKAEEDLAGAHDAKATARAEKALASARTKAVADARKASKATGTESATMIAGVLEALPEHRSKQGRWFPTVVPADPVVWMSWPDAEPTDDQLAVLDRLCSRVARLGHSSTFVSCRATVDPPPPATLVPGASDGETLRVPRAGMIDRLERDFAAQGGRVQGPLPAGSAVYAKPGATEAEVPTPLLGGDWIVLSMPRPLGPGGPEALRLTHGGEPAPEILSGHQAGARPTAALQRPHLAIVPMPNVGARHSDGAVLGVALVLPASVTSEEYGAVEDAVRAWSEATTLTISMGGPSGRGLRFQLKARLDPAPGTGRQGLGVASEERATLRRTTWCRPSTEWATTTPIALDRFPGDLGSRRPGVRSDAEDAAKMTVGRACRFAGLPEPAEVEVDSVAFLGSVPTANGRGGFPAFTAGSSGQVRLGVHARLRFDEPVAGPVLIGAGRYLGYGLCLPLDHSRRRP